MTTPRATARRRCRLTISRRSAPSSWARGRRSRQVAAVPPSPRAPRSAGGRHVGVIASSPTGRTTRRHPGSQPAVPSALATDCRGFGGGRPEVHLLKRGGRREATESPTRPAR